MIKCNFCGYRFSEGHGITGCKGCPVNKTCGKCKCPNCGYEIPQKPGLLKFFKKYGKKTATGPCSNCSTTPLTSMQVGQTGTIAKLDTKDGNTLRKLLAMGILPGMTIKMIQNFPAYVLQVGYTQVALDKETAQVIMVAF